MNIVVTQPTLQALLTNNWPIKDAHLGQIPSELQETVVAHETVPATLLLYSGADGNAEQLIVIPSLDTDLIPPDATAALWQRVSSLALLAQERRLDIPRSWGQFRSKNKIAFAAVSYDYAPLRWNAEINPEGSKDLVLWRLETTTKVTDLELFDPPTSQWRELRDSWVSERLNVALPLVEGKAQTLSNSIELVEATFGAVTAGSSYSNWLPKLTNKQREFVDTPSTSSVKLRGPAGSGKTLTLELKLLSELYKGRRNSPKSQRYLYATHSWSVAEQASDALRRLDESGDLSEVDVLPLLTVAEAIGGASFSGFEILGEDSQSGKTQQLALIDELVQVFRDGDWLAFQSRVSTTIKESVEAAQGSLLRNRLNWDLMLEFGTVLSANGILPGVAARERYKAVPRAAWMMPVRNDADREFVLLIYTRLVAKLGSEGKLSSDQVINDLLNYLETFAWNIRRVAEGYDQIYVDELHLFTEQERFVLQYLARDPSTYPTLFMALDPRQSPAELYTNVDSSQISRSNNLRAELALGTVRSVELSTVHRFSPQILDLVRHVNQSFPAMDLGDEWELDLSGTKSSAPLGELPTLIVSTDLDAQRRALMGALHDVAQMRTALVVADAYDLYDYVGYFNLPNSIKTVVIDSRDAVENLRYAKRALVVSAAEYVAGLQFEHVVVVMGESSASGLRRGGHRFRRQISNLYLALTRASRRVTLSVIVDSGSVPEVIDSAVSNGILLTTDTR